MKLHIQWIAVLGVVAAGGVAVMGMGCSSTSGPTGNSCAADTTVTGCLGSDGYSCAAGDAPPDSADPTLICSAPNVDGADDTYCCYTSPTFPAGTCAYDSSLDAACTPDSLGYSCQGTDTPDQTDTSLTCSPDQGSGDFCCTTN